jgi:hypothetical protein
MPRNVTRELPAGSVPATVRLGFGLQARALTKKGEHAVGLEFEEILGVEILRDFERPTR